MLMSRDVMENVFGVFSIMPDCNGTCVEFASDSLECSGTSRWFLFVVFKKNFFYVLESNGECVGEPPPPI